MKRLYIEAKFPAPQISSGGHTYLTLRDEESAQDIERLNNSQDISILDDKDDVALLNNAQVIRGGPENFEVSLIGSTLGTLFGSLTIQADVGLAETLDKFIEDDTKIQHRSFLDITSIVEAAGFSAEAAWAAMVAYIRDADDIYDYEVPDLAVNHTSNSNATIFSALNAIGIDARTLVAGLNQKAGWGNAFYPGITGDSTLIGGNGTEIVAALTHTEGVKLLGRDNVDDIFTGTKFTDWYFGEQEASNSATFDTVRF